METREETAWNLIAGVKKIQPALPKSQPLPPKVPPPAPKVVSTYQPGASDVIGDIRLASSR